jgi:nucleoid-associated protein YgaU
MEHTEINQYKERLSALLQKDMPYIVLGSVVMIGLVGYASLAIYKNNYNIFAPKNTGPTVLSINAKSETVEKMIKDQKLDLVTPSPTLTPTPSFPNLNDLALPEQDQNEDEDTEDQESDVVGEISAISSGQVTYKEKTYIVQEGDTLAIIASKVYGDENAWQRIADENGIFNPDDIYVGLELQIPR